MELIDTLIEARWIIPIVPKGVILENSALAVNAGRIVDILPFETAEKTYQAQKVFRFPTSALLPGFVNLHSHAAMNLVRGLGADLPLMDWLTKEIWPAEGKLMSPEFVAEGSWLAGLEMAASGVTTTSDHYFFPKSAAEGLLRAGLRCAVSGIVIGFPSAWAKNDTEYLSLSEALIQEYEGDPFVHTTIAPHAPYTVNDAALKHCAEISDKYGVPIHMHVNETAVEVSDSLRDHHERPIDRLKRLGLLNERLIAAPVFAMLEAATLGGARALRWDADIGSLEIGKAADLFAIDLGTPESLPVADPAAQILYSAGRECITHTWVDGRLIMEKHARAAYPQTDALAAAALCAQKWQSRLKN